MLLCLCVIKHKNALEEARNAKIIGKSLEAHLTVYASEEVKTLLTALDSNIAQLLIVSQIDSDSRTSTEKCTCL